MLCPAPTETDEAAMTVANCVYMTSVRRDSLQPQITQHSNGVERESPHAVACAIRTIYLLDRVFALDHAIVLWLARTVAAIAIVLAVVCCLTNLHHQLLKLG